MRFPYVFNLLILFIWFTFMIVIKSRHYVAILLPLDISRMSLYDQLRHN